MAYDQISFVAADMPQARDALYTLTHRYGSCPPDKADVIIALGGDGFMLSTLHKYMNLGVPFYGMNRGTIGFMLNEFDLEGLTDRLDNAEPAIIRPLHMTAHDCSGETTEALALNEVSLLRETRQTAKIRISIDGKTRLEELICDGALVATPAGSTAYNLSAHGPVLPITADLLALTPISAFRPRRWRGALLPHTAQVTFEVLEAEKRPVSAVADHTEVRDVRKVDVRESNISIKILFDAGHTLEERIIREQFVD